MFRDVETREEARSLESGLLTVSEQPELICMDWSIAPKGDNGLKWFATTQDHSANNPPPNLLDSTVGLRSP